MAERWKKAGEQAGKIWCENLDSAIDLSGHFNIQAKDACDGKTVVENRGMGLIVETIAPQ